VNVTEEWQIESIHQLSWKRLRKDQNVGFASSLTFHSLGDGITSNPYWMAITQY
jgi:hypothetical protein